MHSIYAGERIHAAFILGLSHLWIIWNSRYLCCSLIDARNGVLLPHSRFFSMSLQLRILLSDDPPSASDIQPPGPVTISRPFVLFCMATMKALGMTSSPVSSLGYEQCLDEALADSRFLQDIAGNLLGSLQRKQYELQQTSPYEDDPVSAAATLQSIEEYVSHYILLATFTRKWHLTAPCNFREKRMEERKGR